MEHPNIVLLKGVCLNPPCICTEFMNCGKVFHLSLYSAILIMAQGDLHSFLDDGRNTITWQQCILIAKDVAAGMYFLHSQVPPKIHRDLKSPNILVNIYLSSALIGGYISLYSSTDLPSLHGEGIPWWRK